ncbi:MAG: histidine kinase, partial [Bacteroidetes bacterium]|nr:histidine kinase [Bacteroidota bacterium]
GPITSRCTALNVRSQDTLKHLETGISSGFSYRISKKIDNPEINVHFCNKKHHMVFPDLFHKNTKRFIVQQGLFWLISIILFTVVLIYTRGDFNFYNINLRLAVNILITVGFLAISVYINLLWLIPVFFNKRRYLLFTTLEVANILLFILLNYFVTYVFEGGRYPANFLSEFIAEFILVLLFLIVSTLLKFMRDSIALQDVELRIKEVEKQKIEAELRALKSQVNPHFFFNTLNSLYALSLDKSDKAPELILKLSDLMRYVIYESKDDLVPVGKQLEFLQSYVYLEQLRTNESLDIQFDITGDHVQVKIAPLLYLAFIENAFKHGAKDKNDDPFIHINFNLEHEDQVIFTIENRTDQYQRKSSGGGFGLSNVKKRLELLYPGRHELKISESLTIYRVELTIFVI